MEIIQKNEINQLLKNNHTDFNYIAFFVALDQEKFLKDYMYNKAIDVNDTSDAIKNGIRYFRLKVAMRNLDWEKIAKSGVLQQKFILSQFSIADLVNNKNKILPNPQEQGNLNIDLSSYLPIKIFTYLPCDLLCKYNNLCSSSNSSFFYKNFLDKIEADKEEYMSSSSLLVSSYEKTDVHMYDFLENSLPNKYTNNSKYSYRVYDSESDPFTYFTYDKKYMGEIQYNVDVMSLNSVISTSSITTEYISNSLRHVGIDKNELLQHQTLELQFAKQHYNMDEICRYYKFSESELNANKEGLELKNSGSATPYNFEILFKYQNFNTDNDDFKNFMKYHISSESTFSDSSFNQAKKNFCLYQTFDTSLSLYDDFIEQLQSDFSTNSSNSLYADYKSKDISSDISMYTQNTILAIPAKANDDLFVKNVKFQSSLELGYTEKRYIPDSSTSSYTISYYKQDTTNYNAIKSLANISNVYAGTFYIYNNYNYNFIKDIRGIVHHSELYSDNIIITNCDVQDKIRMICAIKNIYYNNNYCVGYHNPQYQNGTTTPLTAVDINEYLRNKTGTSDRTDMYPIIYVYKDSKGYYIRLWTEKYHNYQCGKINADDYNYTTYHSNSRFDKNTQFVCNRNQFNNKNYYIVGTKDLLRYPQDNLIEVKVYFKDIMAILDNKCLAVKKLTVDSIPAQ